MKRTLKIIHQNLNTLHIWDDRGQNRHVIYLKSCIVFSGSALQGVEDGCRQSQGCDLLHSWRMDRSMIGQEPKGSNYLPLLSNPSLVLRSLEMEKKRYNPDLRSSCLVVGCVCVWKGGTWKHCAAPLCLLHCLSSFYPRIQLVRTA
jgi:hypothetical protein